MPPCLVEVAFFVPSFSGETKSTFWADILALD